jgi:hypothetical protein
MALFAFALFGSSLAHASGQSLSGGLMLRSILVSVLLSLSLAAQAGGLILNDLRAQNGVQLSVAELKKLMPNAKVVSYQKEGSPRLWTNEPGGKLVASSGVSRDTGKPGKSSTAQGTWHVGDNGTYCVTLDWPKQPENWCRYILKADDKYYGVKSVTDGVTIAHEFEFSK